MFIIGNINTDELVDYTGTYLSPPSAGAILNRISTETGIPVSGLNSYYETDKSIQTRIQTGAEFTLTWTDVYNTNTSGYDHRISAVDFSLEDDKRQVVFVSVDPNDETVRKPEIENDGIDESRILVNVYTPNMSGIDISYSGTLRIPFIDPDGRSALASVPIISGIGYKDFKTTTYGKWIIPSKYNFEDMNAKVYSGYTYDIEVLMNI